MTNYYLIHRESIKQCNSKQGALIIYAWDDDNIESHLERDELNSTWKKAGYQTKQDLDWMDRLLLIIY